MCEALRPRTLELGGCARTPHTGDSASPTFVMLAFVVLFVMLPFVVLFVVLTLTVFVTFAVPVAGSGPGRVVEAA
jgi:hypothetical protein